MPFYNKANRVNHLFIQIYQTLTLLETPCQTMSSCALVEFIFQRERWKLIYSFLLLNLSLQVCDVFNLLTLSIHSHLLWLPILDFNFFNDLWVIPKSLLRVCLSNYSNNFASSKFPLLNFFLLICLEHFIFLCQTLTSTSGFNIRVIQIL